MNLHGIVAPAISIVNPMVPLSIRISTGSTTAADGKRTPTYATPITVLGQIQALQYNDIMQLDGLNIEGMRRKIYIAGKVDGLVRADQKGGDLITTPDGKVWLVALVLEYWPDWVSCAVTLQKNA
jgi:hypothetical protein